MATTRLPRAARRAQLIDAAAGAFLERGYDGTSMDDVARAAGVSRLIVYRIFDTKQELYRAVLSTVLMELGQQFAGLDVDEVQARGATNLVMPVARAHADAFRLLSRHASREPDFADLGRLFVDYVTDYARRILQHYITDEVVLDWAAHTAGAHLVDGVCTWLDVGDPARDDEFSGLMTRGLRGLAASWRASG